MVFIIYNWQCYNDWKTYFWDMLSSWSIPFRFFTLSERLARAVRKAKRDLEFLQLHRGPGIRIGIKMQNRLVTWSVPSNLHSIHSLFYGFNFKNQGCWLRFFYQLQKRANGTVYCYVLWLYQVGRAVISIHEKLASSASISSWDFASESGYVKAVSTNTLSVLLML